MDYEDDLFDEVIDPLKNDLKNLMGSFPYAEEVAVRTGVRKLLCRIQNAILLLINYGDWPHFSFPLAFDPAWTSAQEVFGVTAEHLASFYERARDCFERENYSEAADICLLLAKLNPEEMTYWVALGMAEQLQGNFQEAAMAYSTAIDLNQEDLTPGLYAARCLIRLGEISLARKLLMELLNVESGDESGSFIKEATSLIEALEDKA
jgi:tetratricopeptide (TPR) repeat protein